MNVGESLVVAASTFGGPHDPGTGSIGYHGDDLHGTHAFAELSRVPRVLDFSALGNLPYRATLSIENIATGEHVIAEKLDVGAGGDSVRGYPRCVDLWYETARAIGLPDVWLGLVRIRLLGVNVGHGNAKIRIDQLLENGFCREFKLPVPALVCDGVKGSLTDSRTEYCHRALGYKGSGVTADLDKTFIRRLRRPYLRSLFYPAMFIRGVNFRRRERARAASPLRVRAYRVALTLVGVRESWGANSGPMVDRIIRANGGQIGESWCGDAMDWCYRLAGSHAISRSWASVPLLGGLAGIRRVSVPQQGDLVTFDWNGNGSPDHVGMFVRGDPRGDFTTLEGNTHIPGGEGFGWRIRNAGFVHSFLRVER